MREYYFLLRKAELFKNIGDEELDVIFENINSNVKIYFKNDIIAEESDKCDSLGIILEGEIELSTFFISGDTSNLTTMGSGRVFAEGIIFSPIDRYPISIKCIEDAKILYINRQEILYLMNKSPLFLENYLLLLSKKLLLLNSKFKLLSLSTIRGKLAHVLIDLSKKQNSYTVKLPFTREKLASYISNKRPSVSREFKNMKRDGLIDYRGSTVEILDIEGLKRELY